MNIKNRNVFWLGIVSMFTDCATSLVMPLIPLYVVMILDEGIDKVGIILAVTSLASYLLRFVGGILSDRYAQNKPFLVIGYGMSALAKPLFALAGGWLVIAVLRTGERLGKAVRAAPKDKLIGLSAQKGAEGSTFGNHKALEKLGELAGLALLLGFLHALGSSESAFRIIFAVSAIPGVLAMLVLIFCVREIPGGKSTKKPSLRITLQTDLRMPVISFVVIMSCLFNEAFFVLLAKESGLALTHILLLLAGMRVVQIIVSKQGGSLIDQLPVQRVMTIGYGLALLSMLLLINPSLFSLTCAFLLYGAGEVLLLNSIRGFISKQATDKGAAFGFLYFALAIGTALGSYGLSLAWQHFGALTAVWISCITLIIAGGVLLRYKTPSI